MSYRFVIATRVMFILLQLAALLAFAVVGWIRSGGGPAAVGSLPAGHVLTAADLNFDAKELLGKQLKQPIGNGLKITPEMVKDAPTPVAPLGVGTVAAVVQVNEGEVVQRSLDVGATVSVERKALPALPGRILSRNCEKKRCTLVVVLDTLPKDAMDLTTFATADVQPRPAPGGAPAKP